MDPDDLYDVTNRESLAFVIGAGLFEAADETICACACGCEQAYAGPDEICDDCASGVHLDGRTDRGDRGDR